MLSRKGFNRNCLLGLYFDNYFRIGNSFTTPKRTVVGRLFFIDIYPSNIFLIMGSPKEAALAAVSIGVYI